MMTNSRALQLARDAFAGSTSYFDANIRPQVERDLRTFQSRHAADSKYLSDAYRTRSRLFRPKTRAAIRKNEAISAEAFFSTDDVVEVAAEDDSDPEQRASSEVMKALINYRLKKSIPWFLLVMGAYQDAMATGVVISHQYWEYDPVKKIDRPVIELLPIENFRFDPGASWHDPIGTSPYLIQLVPMYLKDVKYRMRPGPAGEAPKWFPLSNEQLVSAARDYDSTRLLREDNRTDSRDSVTAITEFSIVWVHRVILEDGGRDLIYYTLGDQFLLSLPVPLEESYAHGRRPYVMGCCVIETHKPYPSSASRLTLGVQTEINEVANQRIDNVKLALNKRYFVKRNKQVDVRSLTRNTPGSVTMMMDPEGDVKVFDTPDVTGSSYQEQDRLNLDFDEMSGAFSPGSVQSNRKLNETVGGMNMLTDNANQLCNYQLKTFVETWVEPALRQLVLLEQHYETDARILALAGRAAFEKLQRLGRDQVTDDMLMGEMTLTVSVGMGTTSPTRRIDNLIKGIAAVKEALADGTLAKFGVDATEIIKEVFGALGHKNGGRFFKHEEDPRLAGLQAEIEQLQQQLEAKMPQALVDATVRKMDAEVANMQAQKVEAGVTASYAAMQAAEVIAAVPQVAPIADKVMQAAGYIAPAPPGIDPNFPNSAVAAGGAGPGLTPAAAEAAQSGPVSIPGSQNTSPMFPPRPGTGQTGIETQRADGAVN
jgi:hypothetical protein